MCRLVISEKHAIRNSKIVLQCRLKPGYCIYRNSIELLDVPSISKALNGLYNVEVQPRGMEMSISAVVPVGPDNVPDSHTGTEWLVIELKERRPSSSDFLNEASAEKFLTEFASKIIQKLTRGEDDHRAVITISGKEIVLTDAPDGAKDDDIVY